MSKDEKISKLSTENLVFKRENEQLKFELAQLKRLIFGSKKERFIANGTNEIAANQGSLFATPEDESNKEPVTPAPTEKISYERKKPKKKHEGRNKIPDHLPTEEVIIEPEEDTTGLKKIGEEVTETLEYTPASLVKKITRRPKYAKADGEGILIGKLPSRPIGKSIAEASLLAHIMVCKFIDHLPFYRQIQIFKRNYDWHLASSTINDWFIACCTLLDPLYQKMKTILLQSDYLQADESPIKVQDSDKKNSTHQGYMWVYRCPLNDTVIFQYRKGRGANGPKEMLATYEGYLQTDGYQVYDKIGKKSEINLVGCWTHARRKFFEAKNFAPKLAEFALQIIQAIYHHEKECQSFTAEERQAYRQVHMAPLMKKLQGWAEEQQLKTLPKSPIGKALNYLLRQWHKLEAVLQDGRLEIDNNRIENKIRPLALGRKNYLFAGSHDAAQRIAMMYSFFATCNAHGINPFLWLKDTLDKISDCKITALENLLPQNFIREV